MNLNKDPIISIIVLTFNYGNYLKDCLKSIENQTIKNLEIILIDDWSNDKYTIKYLDTIKDKYLILHTNRKGPSYARNKWISISNWEYILFVDADDYLNPNYLEIALNKIKTTWADFFYPSFRTFWYENNIIIAPNFSVKTLLLNNFIIVTSLIKKKKLIDNKILFDNSMLKWLEDREFWIRVSSHWLLWVTSKEPIVFIRKHKQSRTIWANKNKKEIFKYIYSRNKYFFKKNLSKWQISLMKIEYFFSGKLWYCINKAIILIPKKIRNKIKWVNNK